MSAMEVNKIAGAVIGTALVAVIINTLGNALLQPAPLATPAYPIATQDAPAGAAPAAAEPAVPLGELLAAGNADAGANVAKVCQTCHTFEKGGPARVGPNLFGIVGSPHAHAAGFAYSPAMLADKGKPWTWEELNAWVENPSKAIPGSKMAFAGVKNPKQRADLLLYLNKNSDSPQPLPPK